MTDILLAKTYEYLYPGSIPDGWLGTAAKLWNDGLALLEWRQHWTRLQKCLEVDAPDWGWNLTLQPHHLEQRIHWEQTVFGNEVDDKFLEYWSGQTVAIQYTPIKKNSKEFALCCHLTRQYRIDKTKSWDDENIAQLPYVQTVSRRWESEPPIGDFGHMTMQKQFTKKAGYDYGTMPSGIMQYQVKNLCETWKKYSTGKGGKPKYRGRRNPILSLSYDGFRHHCEIDGSRIKLCGMDWVEIPGLTKHLNHIIQRTEQYLRENPTEKVTKKAEDVGLEDAAAFHAIPGAFCLLERDGKTYLQISGMFPFSTRTPVDKQIEITTGTEYLWKSEDWQFKHVDNSKLAKRIKRLQKTAAKRTVGSKEHKDLIQQIGSLQALQASRVRKQQQFHADWLGGGKYNQVTIAPYVPDIYPAPVPIPDGKGGYAPNGATVIAQNNEKRAKAATAQFVALIGEKAKRYSVEVIDNRKDTCKDKEVGSNTDRPVPPPPQTLNGPKEAIPQGQPKGKQGRAGATRRNSQDLHATSDLPRPTEPRKPRGRNRKREKAIG